MGRTKKNILIFGTFTTMIFDKIFFFKNFFFHKHGKTRAFNQYFYLKLDRDNVGDFGSIWGFSQRYGQGNLRRLNGILKDTLDNARNEMESELEDEAARETDSDEEDDRDTDNHKKLPGFLRTIAEAEAYQAEDA